MPRAELVGTARFVDRANRLCCEVTFGKVPGAESPLLQRTDSCQADLYAFSQPPAEAEKVRRLTWPLLWPASWRLLRPLVQPCCTLDGSPGSPRTQQLCCSRAPQAGTAGQQGPPVLLRACRVPAALLTAAPGAEASAQRLQPGLAQAGRRLDRAS